MIVPMPILMPIHSGGGSANPNDVFKYLLTIWIVCNTAIIVTWIIRILIWFIKKECDESLYEYLFDMYELIPMITVISFFIINIVAILIIFGMFVYKLL